MVSTVGHLGGVRPIKKHSRWLDNVSEDREYLHRSVLKADRLAQDRPLSQKPNLERAKLELPERTDCQYPQIGLHSNLSFL